MGSVGVDRSISTAWSRLVRFVGEDGQTYYGEPVDEHLDVGLAMLENKEVLVKTLHANSALDLNAKFTGRIIKVKSVRDNEDSSFEQYLGETDFRTQLLSPLSRTEVGTIRCIGVNYHDHGAELSFTIPPVPIVFFKPSSCVLSPSEPLVLPRQAASECDWEVELAVVLGKECKNVSEEEALDYVLGYMTANDVTARQWQFLTSQFSHCKSFDGFAPMGPTLVSPRCVRNPKELQLKTTLNGQTMQESQVSNMIFGIERLISHLSIETTLPRGTVILTGTPGGIGHTRTPPIYLKEGDDLRISISHGLGTLANPIIADRSSGNYAFKSSL